LLFHYYHEKNVEDITQQDITQYIIFIKSVHGVVSFPEVRPFKNRKLIRSFTNFKWNKNEKDTIYRKSNHCYVEAT
jgi:hypothetical protein